MVPKSRVDKCPISYKSIVLLPLVLLTYYNKESSFARFRNTQIIVVQEIKTVHVPNNCSLGELTKSVFYVPVSLKLKVQF